MQEQLSSSHHPVSIGSRQLTLICLAATLIAWLAAATAFAQTPLPTAQPSAGMGATSPLNMGALRPEGIPLGSTEIATPGLSPVSPSSGMGNCAVSGNAGSPGALFDGGGLSGSSSPSCIGGMTTPPALSSSPSVGRVGIPLGATELGSAGLSPALPVPNPNDAAGASSTNIIGNP
jgi:hypothetical protein